MRGKPIDAAGDLIAGRITPADAGKTEQVVRCKDCLQDHPRGCGENESAKRFKRWVTGSPPQVRGKRLAVRIAHLSARITPAGAGKTIPHRGVTLCH